VPSILVDELTGREGEILKTECWDLEFVYPGQSFEMEISYIVDNLNEHINHFNSVVRFYKVDGVIRHLCLQDSIYYEAANVNFANMDSDTFKEFLVKRSTADKVNNYYDLYDFDFKNNTVKKIRHFQDIPNPSYLREFDLIKHRIYAGLTLTAFYKINADSVTSFSSDEFTVNWGYFENTTDTNANSEYTRKLKAVLKEVKKRDLSK
jgi:hypothetical protein